MARRRPFHVFNMSFLDCVSCGFGAVLLVFLIISAQITEQTDEEISDLRGETLRMEIKVSGARAYLTELNDALGELTAARDTRTQRVRGAQLAAQLAEEEIESLEGTSDAKNAALERAKQELRALEAQSKKEAEKGDAKGQRVLRVAGTGQRQYLTGLRMGGDHVLILVDSSASMLARDIVNILRLRNMDDAVKRNAPKWQQAVATVEWLAAQLPPGGHFQIYDFAMQADPLVADTRGKWLEVGTGDAVKQAVERLRQLAPEGGTSLHAAFGAVDGLSPRPDNVYLIVDGLPTQSSGPPTRGAVSGAKRLKLFESALRALPSGVPMNVILLPMEGDPDAAMAYWMLARRTGGSLLSPSVDWP